MEGFNRTKNITSYFFVHISTGTFCGPFQSQKCTCETKDTFSFGFFFGYFHENPFHTRSVDDGSFPKSNLINHEARKVGRLVRIKLINNILQAKSWKPQRAGFRRVDSHILKKITETAFINIIEWYKTLMSICRFRRREMDFSEKIWEQPMQKKKRHLILFSFCAAEERIQFTRNTFRRYTLHQKNSEGCTDGNVL